MSANEVIKKLEALRPAIRERREEIERERTLPRDLVDELIGTGVFRLAVPRAIGGMEATAAENMRAVEAVSMADGSAGWVVMIGMSGNIAAGYMNEPGAREIFGDPRVISAALAGPIGAAVPADGGYTVSGRWPFGSGIKHSDWVWAGCIVMEDGAPKMTPHGPAIVHAFLPADRIEIHDTWHVSGLCGTGSHDFSAEQVFVPEHQVFSLFDPSGHRPEPLYQIPVVNLFVSQVAAVGLGIARGALDDLIDLAPTKTPTLSQAVLADKPLAQIELARAEASLGAARTFMYATIEELEQVAEAGGVPTMRQRALGRVAAVQAIETAARVTQMANTVAGGSSIYSRSSMQRHMRDAEALTHHFTIAPHVWEDAGRVLLGREPTAMLF